MRLRFEDHQHRADRTSPTELAPHAAIRYGGLFQRASIITGFAWLTAILARALHRILPGMTGLICAA